MVRSYIKRVGLKADKTKHELSSHYHFKSEYFCTETLKRRHYQGR